MRAPCKIDGCDRPSKGRGWCGTHWLRWRNHGDPTVVLRVGVDYQVKPPCAVDGCPRPHHAKGYCSMHLVRFNKHGDPSIVAPIAGRPLKGDAPTWAAVHKRLERQLGRASERECIDCGGPAKEWSYTYGANDELVDAKGLRYSEDFTFYAPRCIPCHRRYDMAHPRCEVATA